MKQKITIMKNNPELSDDEIRSYMNFDQLVAARNIKLKTARRSLALKLAVPLILASAFSAWYFVNNRTTAARTVSTSVPPPPKTQEVPTFDSVQNSSRIVQTPENPKAVARKRAPKNAVIAKADSHKVVPPVTDEYIQAEPVEGYASLYHYLNTNLHYPNVSVKDSIEGVETVSFTISKEGKTGNIIIVQSLGTSFDTESKRLIENMPAWKPATLNGVPVESKMSIPLTFQIRTLSRPRSEH